MSVLLIAAWRHEFIPFVYLRRTAPPNSSQQPTRGRSLARRFRASFCATLRVALPDREGRARLSERTMGGLLLRISNLPERQHDRHALRSCQRCSSATAHVKRPCHRLVGTSA